MLIISKFKDYYDSVAYQNGMDKTVVYKRETRDLLLDDFVCRWFDRRKRNNYFPSYMLRGNSYAAGVYEFDTFVLGFCGKTYPMMAKRIRCVDEFRNTSTRTEFVYDIDEIRKMHDTHSKGWMQKFDQFEDMVNSERVHKLFQEHKTPVFLLSDKNVRDINFRINPVLKDIEFYRVMDTFTAFQEIEMFVSQQLCTEKDTSNMSDKDKIIGHGFDYRHSFRKEKENG